MKQYFFLLLLVGILMGFARVTLAFSSGVDISAVVPEASVVEEIDITTGGNLILDNTDESSVLFVVPPNFYGEDLDFFANSYENDFFADDKPAPSGKEFVGKTYDFEFFNSSGGEVATISKSIEITITYTNEDLIGVSESTLAPYRREDGDASWTLIPGATLDTANNRITFSTSQFSSFALFASTTAGTGGGGSGGGGSSVSGGGGQSSSPTTIVKTVLQAPIVLIKNTYQNTVQSLLQQARAIAAAIEELNRLFRKNEVKTTQPPKKSPKNSSIAPQKTPQTQGEDNFPKEDFPFEKIEKDNSSTPFAPPKPRFWLAELIFNGVYQMQRAVLKTFSSLISVFGN